MTIFLRNYIANIFVEESCQTKKLVCVKANVSNAVFRAIAATLLVLVSIQIYIRRFIMLIENILCFNVLLKYIIFELINFFF